MYSRSIEEHYLSSSWAVIFEMRESQARTLELLRNRKISMSRLELIVLRHELLPAKYPIKRQVPSRG